MNPLKSARIDRFFTTSVLLVISELLKFAGNIEHHKSECINRYNECTPRGSQWYNICHMTEGECRLTKTESVRSDQISTEI